MASIRSWGNSLAVRIPAHVAKAARLHDGQEVTLEVGPDNIVSIRPQRPRYTLDALLDQYEAPEGGVSEIDWGAPVGRELL